MGWGAARVVLLCSMVMASACARLVRDVSGADAAIPERPVRVDHSPPSAAASPQPERAFDSGVPNAGPLGDTDCERLALESPLLQPSPLESAPVARCVRACRAGITCAQCGESCLEVDDDAGAPGFCCGEQCPTGCAADGCEPVGSIAAGASPVEAAILSNHAAGIVVGKVGTAVTSPGELMASFKRVHYS